MKLYSDKQTDILKQLASFQYLTSSQLVRLGIAKTRKGVYPSLRVLASDPRAKIGKINYKVQPTSGKPETVHYLKKHGVKLLLDYGYKETEIKYPKRDSVSFASDYNHRVWMVDFFIEAKNWANNEGFLLEDFYYYFQQSKGSNRNNRGGKSLADNRIDLDIEGVGYIIPDGVGIIDRGENKPLFFLFEQHNGKDTGRFLKQVHGHMLAIREGLPSTKYKVQHKGDYVANRVFCVFELESCKEAVQYRLAKSARLSQNLCNCLSLISGMRRIGNYEKRRTRSLCPSNCKAHKNRGRLKRL